MSLGKLEILSDEEKTQLLEEFNGTRTCYPKDKTLQVIFEEQADKMPDAIALKLDDQEMSYKELNEKANQIAGFLRKKGVKPNTIVGLLADRSFDMMIGIWGILKAGGAYLPIDSELPSERALGILKDSEALLLLAQDQVFNKLFISKEHFSIESKREAVLFEDALDEISKFPKDNIECCNDSSDLAYVMYTSGSTGVPKGILTTHYNISRVVKNTNYITIKPSDIILQLSNFAFDGSTFDIFGALLNGAQLILAKKETFLDISKLANLIQHENVTVFFVTTALFNTLVDLDANCLCKVRKVLFGGERVSVSHVKKALEIVGKDTLIHVYGPTETTVFATYYPIHYINEALGTIPIGKPISNTEVYILDKDLNLLPSGTPGELYIGGDGLAKGYLNRPQLSEERFVGNPFNSQLPTSTSTLIYKTGDLVRWLPDGNIEFLDRLDNQVKLRGFRIELGEIEAKLLSHEMVKKAIVIARDDRDGNKYLCSYLVADEQLKTSEVRDYLSKILPQYMIPSQIIILNELPVTPNGKIDLKVLTKYSEEKTAVEFENPSNSIEEKLVGIWRDVLGVEKISTNDNFFDLGGHSLKATILASKIHKSMNVEVPLAEILRNATVKQLAKIIINSETNSFSPIELTEQREYYPVSSAQKRMFIQQHSQGVDTAYNMPLAIELKGKVDRERLENALKELVQRHEALRTSFCMIDGQIVQKINKGIEFATEYAEVEATSLDQMFKDFILPFDLSIAPLFRTKLVKVAQEKYILLINMHHIISDGVSVMVLIEELAKVYEGKRLENLSIQYKEYAVWQEELLESDKLRKQETFWMSNFLGEIPLLNMPLDYKRHEKRSYEGNSIRFTVSAQMGSDLDKLAKQNSTTINNLLMSIYFILLNKYTNQKDIVVGSLVAGRSHQDVQRIVGMFNNFLPIRMDVDVDSTFLNFLKTASSQIMDCYNNQEYPYDRLIENIGSRLDQSRNPLFDTMLILHNELEVIKDIKFGDIVLSNLEFEHNTSKLDFKLDVYFEDSSKELKCILEYNVDIFNHSTMERVAEHFKNIIKQVTTSPDIKLKELELLSNQERNQILKDFNATEANYPKDKTVYQLFEEQVIKTPDNIAVIFEGKELTYSQLNKKANQLARTLREKGVKGDSIVAIMTERSLEMIIGIMAVVKAGGAYLPISPEYPDERIKYMLVDSGAAVLLVQSREVWEQKPELGEVSVISISLEDESLYSVEDTNLEMINTPKDLAYVIYTSGSTGKPKGAMIEHYSLVNRLNWMQKKYPIGEGDTILQKTPYTFDVSVWEMFWWSIQGARVCFLKPGGERDPGAIVDMIEQRQITTMHFVPSMLTAFLTYIENGIDTIRLKSLKQVFASGEALNVQQVTKFNKHLYENNGTKLHNLYGPTEATVDVSYFDCSTGEEFEIIPIGKPIDNINLFILNSEGGLQPIGVPGELFIAGDGLARGYLNRPELTAERFIKNPFEAVADERMYKTGDLARWLPDGNIEYLGRIDNQVKVRGYRIELGEIEAELIKNPEISEAVVTVRDDEDGSRYLCAYIVAARNLSVSELRSHLSKNLPEYMIPSYFVKLESIPLTSNGKVDRKGLPKPEGEINTGKVFEAPVNQVEEKLLTIWQEVLGVEKISTNDNFFELGGHSLKAANLAVKIHKVFRVGVTLGDIFTATTIKKLSVLIGEAIEKEFISIEKIEVKEYHPVSSSQKRLFIINRLEGSNTTYNLPSMVMIEGPLDIQRFKNVFSSMIKRHESLRTSFKLIGEDPVQIIHDEVDFDIEYFESDEKNLKEIAGKFIRPFDLEKAPLIRVALVKIGTEKHLLAFDLHHIIADGVSAVILVKEFAKAYTDEELPPLKLQYKDFAAWQNELNSGEEIEKQKQYWLEAFKGTIPVLNLPTDYTRPSVPNNEGEKLTFKLDNEIVSGLKQIASGKGATLYMVMLAAYNTLLYRYTGQEDIVVGSPTAGRQHADLENMIGMFVNTLALRNYPEGKKSFNDFLEEVKVNSLKAYENQDYQFEKLVDNLDIPRDMSRNPLFDTMFVFQNMGIPQMDIEGLKFLPYSFENRVSKFDLTFEVVENDEDIRLNIEYCTKLFKTQSVESIARHYMNIILEIIKNPDVKLNEIEMLSREEQNQILKGFNATEANYPKDKTVYQLFEEQVIKTPDNIAVMFEDKELTYSQLNKKANQLARTLREKGVKGDSIVAIMTERSLEMIIGIMAVLKAGGAYLPISPEYPGERMKYMLEDSGANILLVQKSEMWERKPELGEVSGEKLSLEDESLYSVEDTNLEMINSPKDLAYVIYTSGSTGKPKGAMIEHYSLVNRLNWMQKKYPIGEGDTILQKTPYTFDVSVWEMFWWSMQGARVCFLKPGGEKDPGAIVGEIEQKQITTMHFVPSMLTAFLTYIENGIDTSKLKSLRQVFASGEALNVQQVTKFNKLLYEKNGTKLHNLYGPTEATVDVSYFDCSTGEEFEIIPIGKPIDNINLFILNSEGGLQPIGVPGELFIAGDGLARGYLNRPELTAERFINNPFEAVADERMYKTGDLARWLRDGNIEYLGRIDNQVKVRGFRIELGEIEAELIKHPEVSEVVVTARDDKDGSKYLCAYIISERNLSVVELRDYLSVNLPEYMIPSYFSKIDILPLTPNGKVDRKALPDPTGDINTGRDFVAPTNEVEEKLVEIWKEVLGVDKVGIHDKFFELGGYSILLIKMHSQVEQIYPQRVQITDLFTYPTIAKLAELIQSSDMGPTRQLPIQTLELPAEYFVIEEKANKEISLKLTLDSDLEAKIFNMANTTGLDITDIMISIYAYLFSQIIEKDKIVIQTAVGNLDNLYSIPINLGEVNKFADLVRQVNISIKNTEVSNIYKTSEINMKSFTKANHSIIPLFYRADLISSNFDILEVFDIAIEVSQEEGNINLFCRFNGKKLNKTKMKEFAGLYIKFVELFLE